MRYDEYFEKICTSTLEDWSYDDDVGLYLYKDDMDITIENDIRWLENANDICYEEWVNRFFEDKAYRKRFILKYREKIVKLMYGVFVDACKCFIPQPDENMCITKEQYASGSIINGFITSAEEFDVYLKKANINVIIK